MKNKAELPPYTVKQLRDILNFGDMKQVESAFKVSCDWYFANELKITLGERSAFHDVLGRLERLIQRTKRGE